MWVFAGYKKPLESLFEHNEGLPSRFPLRFVFEDYTNDELQKIFEDMMIYMPPQLVKKNPPSAKKPKSISSQRNSNYSYGGRFQVPRAGETTVCRFGMTWTFVANLGELGPNNFGIAVCGPC